MARGLKVVADVPIADCVGKEWDAIALPGGMPGAKHLSECAPLVELLKAQVAANKTLGAVCAAPAIVLAAHGLVASKRRGWAGRFDLRAVALYDVDRMACATGKPMMVAMVSFYLFTSLSRGPRSLLPPTATSFPVDAFKSKLAEAGTAWTEARVVVDRSVVTSQGPGTSLQ
eukprot:scaffold74600_cov29-Tisochrysis_lutea.AAC.4